MSTSKNRYQANFSVVIDTDDPVVATERLAELTDAIWRLDVGWLRDCDLSVNFVSRAWFGAVPTPDPDEV